MVANKTYKKCKLDIFQGVTFPHKIVGAAGMEGILI